MNLNFGRASIGTVCVVRVDVDKGMA